MGELKKREGNLCVDHTLRWVNLLLVSHPRVLRFWEGDELREYLRRVRNDILNGTCDEFRLDQFEPYINDLAAARMHVTKFHRISLSVSAVVASVIAAISAFGLNTALGEYFKQHNQDAIVVAISISVMAACFAPFVFYYRVWSSALDDYEKTEGELRDKWKAKKHAADEKAAKLEEYELNIKLAVESDRLKNGLTREGKRSTGFKPPPPKDDGKQ